MRICVVLIVELACTTYKPGYRRPEGTHVPATNVNQCFKICISDYNCVAIDWNSYYGACWIHTKTGITLLPANEHHVHHYAYDRTCWRE